MNESYFEPIFAIFDDKPHFLSILDTFWAIFWPSSHSTSFNDPLTIELIEKTFELNQQILFELNNILN